MTTFGLWFGGSHLGFGTHMPTLAAAVLAARPGPVLEYGAGLYSTPLLHLLCQEMDRELLTLDSDPAWIKQFEGLASDRHRFRAFPNWADSEALVDAHPWAVAFIDHGPDERRVVDARRLAPQVHFLVVHDWEDSPAQRAIAALFQFQHVSKVGPLTAVLSNIERFSLELTYRD